MAKQSGLGQEFHIAGFDLSGDVGSLGNVSTPRALLDVTGINKSAHERINGLADGQISFNVFFNDAALASHAALSTLPTTDVAVQYLTGTDPGDPAIIMTGKQVDYNWSRGADGGLIGSVSVQGDADSPSAEWGEVVCPKTTHASASTTAIWDAGAASVTGCMAQLQAFANTGDDVVYILQDDTAANMATAATYISFGTITAAAHPTTVRKEETDTCNRYRRMQTTGTFTNAIFAVAMREGTAQDDEAYSG
jgi:hypothetical protein